jgi:hypothetical protein
MSQRVPPNSDVSGKRLPCDPSDSHLSFISVFIRETPSNPQLSKKRSIIEVARAVDEDTNNESRSRRPRIARASPESSMMYTWGTFKREVLDTNFDSEIDGIPIMLRILQDIMSIVDANGGIALQSALQAIDGFAQEPFASDVLPIIESLVASHSVDEKYHMWGCTWSKSNYGMRGVSNSEDVYSSKLFAQMESRFGGSSSGTVRS